MPVRVKKSHSALKHGGYSATTILPGESKADFEKLHRDLIDDLTPNGPLEDHIVATVARLQWRLQNLETFRIAEHARNRRRQLVDEKAPAPPVFVPSIELPSFGSYAEDYDPVAHAAACKEAYRAADGQARKELGDAYELAEMGEKATIEGLMKDLEVQDRLEAMFDKCLKRLLFVRGVKSISAAPSCAPPKRVAGPSRAA